MQRLMITLSVAAVAIASPLAAQGRSGKQTRTYIDARGRECRETTHDKGNGDSKYEVKCKRAKHDKARKHDDRDDDDDHADNRNDKRNDNRNDNRNDRDNRDCVDRSGVRCDPVSRRSYPTTLPDMASAVIWGRGQRPTGATTWLGGSDYNVHYVDRDNDGRPESAAWVGRDGQVVQQWIDSNGDGRADTVRLYRGGKLAKVLGN